MRPNLALLNWGIRRLRAGRPPSILSMAVEERVIHPAETLSGPPAIHPEGETERIRALSPWRDPEKERLLVEGGPVLHAASLAHVLEDAVAEGPFLYCGPARSKPGRGSARAFQRGAGPARRLAEAHLVNDAPGAHFFGHLLRADFPLALLPEPGAETFVAPSRPYGHEAGYRRLLDLPRPPELRRARIGRLTVYTDYGQNASKETRYRALRGRLRAALAGAPPVAGPGVFIRRGGGGERRVLANAAEVERMLAALGFDVVDPSALTAEETARRILDARIVVGVEGSHLAHAIYPMADDGAFLTLQPPDRFAMAYKEFADRMGMRFAFLVGDPAGEGAFRIDPGALQRLLERLA